MAAWRCCRCDIDYPYETAYRECGRCGVQCSYYHGREPMGADQIIDRYEALEGSEERASRLARADAEAREVEALERLFAIDQPQEAMP